MKTTIELPDDLLARAKSVARRERTTLRRLIEEGLRWAISRRAREARSFRLKDAAVSGDGVAKGLTEGDWDQIRDLIYRGRGS